jgi:predicted DNA-binding transcriptional regulator AlpA
VADVLPLRSLDPPAATAAADLAPLVVDAARLAPLLTVSVRTVRTWDAAGKLPAPVRIGGRVVWRFDEIRAWLDAGAPDRSTWEARKPARK